MLFDYKFVCTCCSIYENTRWRCLVMMIVRFQVLDNLRRNIINSHVNCRLCSLYELISRLRLTGLFIFIADLYKSWTCCPVTLLEQRNFILLSNHCVILISIIIVACPACNMWINEEAIFLISLIRRTSEKRLISAWKTTFLPKIL